MKFSTRAAALAAAMATVGVAAGIGGSGSAVAQGIAGPFAACPSLDTLETLGTVPDGTRFPCLGIATFSADSDANERGAIVSRTGAIARFDLGIVNGSAVLVPNERALWNLAGDPQLLELYPDRRVHAFAGKPDNSGGGGGGGSKGGGGKGGGGSSQTTPSGVKRIGADSVWSSSTGAGVRVAIVDSGIDLDHLDLNPAADCFFPLNSQLGISSCQDDNGHGTHVAGIVAALDNAQDVVGVAPGATPVAVKVLDQDGYGLDSEVVAGLEWVLNNNNDGDSNNDIDVVNMSLGAALSDFNPVPASCDDTIYGPAISSLTAAGVVVVAAAGNDPDKVVADMAPAGCTGVIAVASTTAEDGSNQCIFFPGPLTQDTASYFTTDGPGVTISAPGERSEDWKRGCSGKLNGILSLNLGGGTTEKAGTSMAAPHVAGVAALLLACSADPADVAGYIQSGSVLGSSAPYDHPVSGSDGVREGILSAVEAINLAGCPSS
jgi:subtilisin family serine protease